MRVVIATDSFAPKIDGVADTAGIVAKLLARRGHSVRVIAPSPGPRGGDGYEVARLPAAAFPLYPELRLTSPLHVAPLVRDDPPDAAIVLTPGPIGITTALALPQRVRLVHIYTTDMPAYFAAYGFGALGAPWDRLTRAISKRAAVTLCPTERVRRDLEARRFPRLEVWGRGVDTGRFHPGRHSDEARARLSGGEPHLPLVLYAGRLATEKRLLCLHEAARMLPGFRFALVGDGPQRDVLERRFAEVASVFTGYLRGDPLAEAFASADVFAFPSDSDTFGQVVLQSMASGVPPVVVRGTAPAELVPNGVAGLHVPAGDPVALAAALRLLALDPERRAAMAANAVAHARGRSWDTLLDTLERLLAGRERPVLAHAT